MESYYAITGAIRYYRTPPEQVEFVKFDYSSVNALASAADVDDKIAVSKAAPIEGPFNFRRWKDVPHVALANLRVDPASALRFTRTYGVLTPDYRGKATSVSVRQIFRLRDDLRKAWQDDDAWLSMLNSTPKALVWVRSTGVEIVVEDLWSLIRVLFLRDRWDGRAKKCESPDCPAPYFLAARKGQKFCSHKCAVLINVRRFRSADARPRHQKSPTGKRGKHAKAKKA